MKNLKGTEKQIEWAENIRKEFLDLANNLLDLTKAEDYKAWLNKRYDTTEEADFIELLETLKQNDSSKFWIENRYDFEDAQSKMKNTINLESDSSARIHGTVIEVIENIKNIK